MFNHLAAISFYDILWYFLLYAFIGWCIEVVFCSVNTGKFVNRGFLNGPVCPIYGFGAVIVVVLLTPLQDNVILLFIFSVLLTSLLELVTGFLLKKLFHTSWWDYSKQPFNIGGYVCLKFSLLWGIACLFLMKLLHPALADIVGFMPRWLGWCLAGILYAALIADLIVTVTAISKMNKELGEITKIASGLHSGSDALAHALGDSAIKVADKLETLDEESKKKKEELTLAMQENKEKLAEGLEAKRTENEKNKDILKARLEKLVTKKHYVRDRLIKAYPSMASMRYTEAMEYMKSHRKNKNSKDNDSGSIDISGVGNSKPSDS